jgi:periplasmic divalent cation tolerance protein
MLYKKVFIIKLLNNIMIQVITTIDKKSTANKIANSLIDQRLAACVQIFPIDSLYRWKGKKEKSKELILFIKGKNFKKIEKTIKYLHTYDTPEIIQVKITKANKNYLNWIDKNA